MKRQEIPLLEYDGAVPAILEPSKVIAPIDISEYCVLTFFQDVIDAFYRETAEKVALRREEGCICVEMETAALSAVAKFRGVIFGQLLYGGDDVSGDEWDGRDWQNRTSIREALFALAAAACFLL
jgi:uridine phosphorylase